jgi:hypothetical protein
MAETNGVLTRGFTLGYGAETLNNLMEVPELGNNAPEKIDITVLSDDVKKSMAGLSDSAQDLAFKFLYEETQFKKLVKLENDGKSVEWTVTLPNNGGVCTFSGKPSVKLGAAAPNGAMTYTLNISVESKIELPAANA